MKTLHLYLTRQVLLSLLMTVAVFTFVLLLGNVLKEIIALLVARQISLGLVAKAIGLLIPYVMAYVLPFAMLTAVLLTFGRFSADQELTAVRASGVSLGSLVSPILLLSLVLCAVCALFNLWIAPQCRGQYKTLIFQAGTQTFSEFIAEDRFITEIPGMILYVRKKDGTALEDVSLYLLENNRITTQMAARRGEVTFDAAGPTIQFRLSDGIVEKIRSKDADIDPEFIGPLLEDPTVWQQAQLTNYETDPIDLSELLRSERKPRISEMNLRQLLHERQVLRALGISEQPVRVQIHRQAAFSFACFAFTLIGIPLAIQAHRRETSIGIAIALALVLVYYTFLILGEALQAKEHLHPHLLMWIPNFLFEALGAWLLLRANRN
jgi:lipopolysaccharide export system permease protein